jgi:hypothetical protein
MVLAAAEQTFQLAVASPGDCMFLWALIVMLATVVGASASVALNRVFGGLASIRHGIVTEHVAPSTLN